MRQVRYVGREAKKDFNESIPPDKEDKKTMELSCLIQPRETDKPQKFISPDWAYTYTSKEDLPYKDIDLYTNFWWIELGGDRDSIHDTEELRDELLKIAFGVWDHIKNHGDYGFDNWVLDWIGFLPGKRESRRYKGEYIINQNDVEAGGPFEDIIAYAGWSMDDHFPEGFYYTEGYPTIFHPAPSPWGITYKSVHSKNIKNLFFAGRNISATHAALSSSRVMGTCGLLGQAVGTAAAIAIKTNADIDNVDVNALQQQLMEDDCYLPGLVREINPLTLKAECNADVVRNGVERSIADSKNYWHGEKGEYIEYTFEKYEKINAIRLIFDSNLNREYDNMPHNYPLNEMKYKVPETLIKKYRIIFDTPDGEVVVESITNRQRLVWHKVNLCAQKIRLVPEDTWGIEEYRVFAFEMY